VRRKPFKRLQKLLATGEPRGRRSCSANRERKHLKTVD
jgi:hypothetical protein